uniref:Glycosyl transferase, WecB/TagA/CpsF family n=1 Tax=Cyanothece sp. (strain PCC 7425 / ATCC 29141) TaxID=395961 RepID=B8HV63_CYAP4
MLDLHQKTFPVKSVLGFSVAAIPFNDQLKLILTWAKQGGSKTICIANTHMLVEAHRNEKFATVLKHADLVTPDGMPLVWMLRFMGVTQQERVAGPDVLPALCHRASELGVSLFFMGSHNEVLSRMQARLKREFPRLKIAGMQPLPFRPLTEAEDTELVNRINDSGAKILLVSLGCPKQEIWMATHKERVKMVMIGLGAAFPLYAGLNRRAPCWMQRVGLEWFYRLIQEPRRLWGRYSTTIPAFIWLALKQLLWTARST